MKSVNQNRSLFGASAIYFWTALICIVWFLGIMAYIVIKYQAPIDFVTRPFAGVLQFVAFLYGAILVFTRHPVFDKKYCQWLANTPWTPAHPLPKGPLRPVWRDWLSVVALSLVSYILACTFTTLPWLYGIGPCVLFVVGLAVVWMLANLHTGQAAYVLIAVAIPIPFAWLNAPVVYIGFYPFLVAAIAWHGVKKSMYDFPWAKEDQDSLRLRKYSESLAVSGWPYRYLLQDVSEFRTNSLRAFIEAAIVAGWVCVIGKYCYRFDPQEDLAGLLLLVSMSSIAFGLCRLATYRSAICNHLCFGQRVATKSWLIPRHDRMFVAPLLMAMIGVCGPSLMYYKMGTSLSVANAIALGLVVFIGGSMGPSVEEQHLTGAYSKFGQLSDTKQFESLSGSNA